MALHVYPLVFKFAVTKRTNLIDVQLAQGLRMSLCRCSIEKCPPVSPCTEAAIKIGIRISQIVHFPISQSINMIREEDDQICTNIGKLPKGLELQMKAVGIQKSQ